MTGAAVAAENIHVHYGAGATGVRALNDISIEVELGELLMILGPSGSGKTTLLQILGALIRPTSGNVLVHGRQITSLPVKQLRRLRLDSFGFVFQSHHLIPTLT